MLPRSGIADIPVERGDRRTRVAKSQIETMFFGAVNFAFAEKPDSIVTFLIIKFRSWQKISRLYAPVGHSPGYLSAFCAPKIRKCWRLFLVFAVCQLILGVYQSFNAELQKIPV